MDSIAHRSRSLLSFPEVRLTGDAGTSQPGGGLHKIWEPTDPSTAVVDIVAIHGLNGHFERTWSDEVTGFNWLQGAVPLQLPGSRIMSFSYNSIVQFSKSTSNIGNFADQLLESLRIERQQSFEYIRPIIFICHSLGGIVFKQALVNAFANPRYRQLASKTAGVMFFGTPHRGSSFATLATTLGSIFKAAGLGLHTNTGLTKDLEPESKVLDMISSAFLQRTAGLCIFTYYETRKMPMLNSLVVDQHSARLGITQELAIPADADHRALCRFPSAVDSRLKLVLAHVLEIHRSGAPGRDLDSNANQAPRVAPVKEKQDQISTCNFLRSLETSDPESHKARNPTPVHGTCIWLSQHQTYRTWHDSRVPSFLWLSADPGCGKSVLASFLVDKFAEMPQTDTCYFFFKSDDIKQRDGVHALEALIRQLLRHRPSLTDLAMKLLTKQTRSVELLWTTFVACVDHNPDSGQGNMGRDIVCILDGLDECEANSKRALTKVLSDYFSDLPARKVSNSRFKVLVSSRPDVSFKVAFGRNPTSPSSPAPTVQTCMIRLRGEDEVDAITSDVNLFIEASILQLQHHGFPEDVLTAVKQQLQARADRTFLWVTLILHLLNEKVEAGASRRELDESLESRDIDKLYMELVKSRLHDKKAKRMLRIMLATPRPMTVEELSIALAIRPQFVMTTRKACRFFKEIKGSTSYPDIEYDIVFPMENHLKSTCGHFVRIIRGKVYFVRETARAFLLCLTRSTADATEVLTFHRKHYHLYLMETCIAYLLCLDGPGTRVGPKSRPLPSHHTEAFLDFASKEWAPIFRKYSYMLPINDEFRSRYYGLCHPKFAGFDTWMPKALEVDGEASLETMRKSMTDDALQDYCVQTLGLRPEVDDESSLGPSHMVYSSNPAAAHNSYFPVWMNQSGAIVLDFKQVGHVGKERDSSKGEEDLVPGAVIRGFSLPSTE